MITPSVPTAKMSSVVGSLVLALFGRAWRRSTVQRSTQHGLGETEIEDVKVRRELVAALSKGTPEHDGSVGMCFLPRHQIVAQRGRKTLDMVICFQCLQMRAKGAGAKQIPGLVSGSPEPVFDRVLEAAGVKLAPKKH